MSLKWIQGHPGVRATRSGGTQTEVFTGNRQKRGDINCFSGKCCRFHVSSFASEPIRVTVTRSREINSSTLLPGSLKQWTATLLPGVVECSGLLPDRKSDAGFMWPIVTAKSVSWRIAIATVCNPSFRNPEELRLSGLSRPCRSMVAVHGRHKSLQSVTCIVGDAHLSLLHALMTQPGGQAPPSPHRPP